VPRFGEAACLGRDDIEWVPDRESFDEPNTRRALSVCGGCVLRVQCAEWALANHEIGLWGGTTTDERARLRRDRRQVPA
jgi:WhiB family redox-sensing transcriptional regulator